MLENYIEDKNGVIKQIEVMPVKYDKNYVINSYNKYGELSNYMSYLRYGYLVAAINKIPRSVLDFGYGNGAFLEVCKINSSSYGYDIGDYPIPDGCIRISKNDMFKKHFDVITFFDSLEHVEDIYFIDKIHCNYIMISVPLCHNFSDQWFKDWKHRRENEHIWHFNRDSLKKFMNSQGFDFICYSSVEDTIRKPDSIFTNILTGVFRKKGLLI